MQQGSSQTEIAVLVPWSRDVKKKTTTDVMCINIPWFGADPFQNGKPAKVFLADIFHVSRSLQNFSNNKS